MRVIIAAAGTAGHINPGLAIANKIKQEEPKAEIIFIGTNRGLENDLVPRAGYKLRTVEAYGLSKKISIETIKNNYKRYNFYGITEFTNKSHKDYGVYDFKRGFNGKVVELIGGFELPITKHYQLHKLLSSIKNIRKGNH